MSLPPLGLVQLSGAGLAHLLTQAGIRWRVVILASCGRRRFTCVGRRARWCSRRGTWRARRGMRGNRRADRVRRRALRRGADAGCIAAGGFRSGAAQGCGAQSRAGASCGGGDRRTAQAVAWCRRRSACLGDYTSRPMAASVEVTGLEHSYGALRVVRGELASIPAPSVACSALPDAARRRCCAASPASRRSKRSRSHWAAASCRAQIQRAARGAGRWDGVPGLRCFRI